mmetsp:Transcript_24422/g.24001  ORF Transcript_24422/g.24001 Transcript_24422/m.24001 type:complete len:82 (-) Transcript_24422:50-295(-)
MELSDLKEENMDNKEDLLETIREMDKDLKFSSKVNEMLLSEQELYKVRDKAQWDENRLEWKIPHFYLNEKDSSLAFPTING